MTITITATPGSESANSYVTLAEANTYLEAHLDASIWAPIDDERKKAALVAATREIDTKQFAGRRDLQEQSLAWPRTGLYDYDSYLLTGVPAKLKYATCELAIWNLTEEDRLAGGFEIDNMESVEIGPIKYKIGPKATSSSGTVDDLIKSMGPYIVVGSDSISQMVL